MYVKGIKPAPDAYGYPLLIRHLLHTPLANFPDREIVYAPGSRYTYRDLMARIGRAAHALSRLGVKTGDTVAVLDWDSHRYLEAFFAVPMLGAVLHTVNVRLAPEQILYTINHAEDDVILVHRDFLPLLEAIKDRIDKPCTFVLIGDDQGPTDTGLEFAGEYEDLLAEADPEFEFQDFDENTRATTFYTTGTTGDPKGVYYSHRQLVLHTLGVGTSFNIGSGQGMLSSDDVYMPITPMFHVHAWGFPYLVTLLGARQVYPGKYVPDHLLDTIERESVTFSHCVPTILHMLLQAQQEKKTDLSGWKVVIGGSALPQDLAARALSLGIDIFGGYGLSETCPVLTVAKLNQEDLATGSEEQLGIRCKAGRALAMVDIKTVDGEGRSMPRDGATTGEVVARAPWLTQGYFKDEQAGETLWRDGHLHTGDIGHIDANGYLKVTDRLKDVIKSGGEWISSLQLEDIVGQMDGVSEAAVIGVADEKWGERALVLVVLGENSQVDDDAIKAHVQTFIDQGVISQWAMPETIRPVDAIDKTSVGKIDKKVLRQKYGEVSAP